MLKILLGFFLLNLLSPCLAVYEDEIGLSDWHQQHIGKVAFAYFCTQKSRVYVATQQGVIASLAVETGDTVWRQVLPSSEHISAFLYLEQRLLVVTETRIRLFSVDGIHLWDQLLSHRISGALLLEGVDTNGGVGVVVVTSGYISMYSARNGERLWSKQSSFQENTRLYFKDDTIYAIGLTPGELLVTSSPKSGINIKLVKVAIPVEDFSSAQKTGELSLTDDGRVLVLIDNIIHGYTLASNSNAFTTMRSLKTLLGKNILSASLTLSNSGVVVQANDDVAFFSDNLLSHYQLPRDGIFAERNGRQLVVGMYVKQGEQGGIKLRTFSGVEEVDHHVNLSLADYGNPIALRVNADGTRVLVVMQDWALCMLHKSDNQVLWVREEALAVITQSEIVDLPPDIERLNDLLTEFEEADTSLGSARKYSLLDAYWRRLSSQFIQIKHFLGLGHDPIAHRYYGTTDLTRKDQFGFKKIIIVLTYSGKVLALSTDKGQVIWGRMFGVEHSARLYVTRVSAHHPAECTIVWEDQALVFNPLSGATTNKTKLDHRAEQVILLPIHDHSFRNLLLFVTASKSAQIFPDTLENRALFELYQGKIYFYQVDQSNNYILGYGFNKDSKFTPTGIKSCSLLWKVNFSQKANSIIAIAGSTQERLHHAAIILGDRNIIPKYSNVNLLAVATIAQTSSGPSPSSVLNVHLIDAVTGSVIYHTYHADCGSNNTKIHQVENSIIYTYWNAKTQLHEATVIDLYDKHTDWSSAKYSDYHHNPPEVVQQSYILPTGVTAIAHTATQRGITAKNIILGLSSGRVVSIERRWLDARRPSPAQVQAMSASDKEEMLIPYHSKISFSVNMVISYNRTIARLDSVISRCTYLESTSLVLATGLDMFFTRLSPAESYDLLNRDFNFFALVITMGLLLMFTFISSHLSKRKDLSKLWK